MIPDNYVPVAEGSGRFSSLSHDQLQTLKAFRKHFGERVAHPRFTDVFLLCFLRARQFDLAAASKMFDEHLNFRSEHHLDDETAGNQYGLGPVDVFFPKLKEFDIRGTYPKAWHGTDRGGRPLYIERTGKIDLKTLLAHTTTEFFMEISIYEFELVRQLILPAASIAAGRLVETTTTILDLNGLSWRLAMDRSATAVLRQITQCQKNQFPETMHCTIIVNAPKIFSGVWSMIKPMLDPKTAAKIQIFDSNADKYVPVLQQLIAPENLPEFLGGKCTCSNHAQGCMYSDKGPWSDPEIKKALAERPYWEHLSDSAAMGGGERGSIVSGRGSLSPATMGLTIPMNARNMQSPMDMVEEEFASPMNPGAFTPASSAFESPMHARSPRKSQPAAQAQFYTETPRPVSESKSSGWLTIIGKNKLFAMVITFVWWLRSVSVDSLRPHVARNSTLIEHGCNDAEVEVRCRVASNSTLKDLDTRGFAFMRGFLERQDLKEVRRLYRSNDSREPSIVDLGSLSQRLRDKLEHVVEQIRNTTSLQVDMLLPKSSFFIMNSSAPMGPIGIPWHQDTESFFLTENHHDYVNLYMAIQKEGPVKWPQQANLRLVPYDILSECSSELDALSRHRGAVDFFDCQGKPAAECQLGFGWGQDMAAEQAEQLPEGAKMLRLDNNQDVVHALGFHLDQLSCAPHLAVGDLLIVRGDVIHRSSEFQGSRVAWSVRSVSSNSSVKVDNLMRGGIHKLTTINRNVAAYAGHMASIRTSGRREMPLGDLSRASECARDNVGCPVGPWQRLVEHAWTAWYRAYFWLQLARYEYLTGARTAS